MATPPGIYTIRVGGRLGATALSAFPSLVAEPSGGDTVLTGWFEDQSALYGALAQIEALGLDLLELRQYGGEGNPPGGTDPPTAW